MDSSCTDISTSNALNDLRPQCPLKMKEIINKEVISLTEKKGKNSSPKKKIKPLVDKTALAFGQF